MNEVKSGRNRLASLLIGATFSAVSLLGASLARASTTITRQAGTRTTVWSEIQSQTSDRISVNEASLTNIAGTLNRGDAFDGALEVYIYPASDTSSSLSEIAYIDTDATVVNNSPNGGNVSGTASATVEGQDIGVDWRLTFASDAARVDGIFTIRNDSAAPFEGFVRIFTDFGSDSNTVVEATSSGDTTVATGDTWVVTSDGGESNGDDPVIVSASSSAGATIGPGTDLDGYDELIWRTAVNLAPGQTVTVNASHCLFETIAEATAAAQAGNCQVAATNAPSTVAIPTLTNSALLALAVLTGLLSAGHLTRRRDNKKA